MLAIRSLSRLSSKPTANLKPLSRHLTALTRRPPVLPARPGVRAAASQVSNRPGSQSIPHAAQNIKEEMGHAIEDSEYCNSGWRDTFSLYFTVAQAIAG